MVEKGNKMPEEYSGNVQGSVGNRPAPTHGGNSPSIPPAGSGNRFAKGEIQGNSKYTGTDGHMQKIGK